MAKSRVNNMTTPQKGLEIYPKIKQLVDKNGLIFRSWFYIRAMDAEKIVTEERRLAKLELIDKIDKHYLEYCRQQNGRPDCKNCGLSRESLMELLK